MKLSQITSAIRRALGYAEVLEDIVVTGEEKHDWSLNAYGGGRLVLRDVTQLQATEFCVKLGTITYTDEGTHMLFYKPTGWQGGLPMQPPPGA